MSDLTDGALLRLVVAYHDQRKVLKDLEAKADELKSEILAALVARDGHLDHDGWKAASVVNTRVSYSWEIASAKWRPALLRRVTVRSVDKTKVAAEIEAGRLLVPDAHAARVVTTSEPYVRVTPPKPADAKAKPAKAA